MAVRYPANKDPFLEDDDEFSFASKSRQGGAYGGTSSGYGGWNETEDDYTQPKTQGEQLQELKENSMNRQLASAQRAVAAIYDSERVGIATAEVSIAKLRWNAKIEISSYFSPMRYQLLLLYCYTYLSLSV